MKFSRNWYVQQAVHRINNGSLDLESQREAYAQHVEKRQAMMEAHGVSEGGKMSRGKVGQCTACVALCACNLLRRTPGSVEYCEWRREERASAQHNRSQRGEFFGAAGPTIGFAYRILPSGVICIFPQLMYVSTIVLAKQRVAYLAKMEEERKQLGQELETNENYTNVRQPET